MPKVRLLAPWTNPNGQPNAQGAVIDVSDEEAKALTARGAASLVEEEQKLEQQQASSAVYDDTLKREGSGSAPADKPAEQPAADKPPEPPQPEEPPQTTRRR